MTLPALGVFTVTVPHLFKPKNRHTWHYRPANLQLCKVVLRKEMWPQGNDSVSLHWITNWGFFMSKIATNIADHKRFQTNQLLRPEMDKKLRDSFDLGRHWYSGSPGDVK